MQSCENAGIFEQNTTKEHENIIENFRNILIKKYRKSDFYTNSDISFMKVGGENIFMMGTVNYPKNLGSYSSPKGELIVAPVYKELEKYIKKRGYEKVKDDCGIDHIYKLDKNGKRIQELKPGSIDHLELFLRVNIDDLNFRIKRREVNGLSEIPSFKAQLKLSQDYLEFIEKYNEKKKKQDKVKINSQSKRKAIN